MHLLQGSREAGLTGVAEVDELFGQQVCEQLHDEQQVLVLVLLRGGVAPLPALVVFGVDLQQRQTQLVQLHGLHLRREDATSTLGTQQTKRTKNTSKNKSIFHSKVF